MFDTGPNLLVFTEADCRFYFRRLDELVRLPRFSDRADLLATALDAAVDLDPSRPPPEGPYVDLRWGYSRLGPMAIRLFQWGKGSVYNKARGRYVDAVTVQRWGSRALGGRIVVTIETGEVLIKTTDDLVVRRRSGP